MNDSQTYLSIRGILHALAVNAQGARETAMQAEDVIDSLADGKDSEEILLWRTVIQRADTYAKSFDELRAFLLTRLT